MTTARLPDPPAQYDAAYMARLINQINLQFRSIETIGALQGTTMSLATLPASAAGLRSGDVWCDAGASNVLKKVP